MKNDKKSELKVGIMVVAGLLLFIWILSWAKNFSFTSNQKDLKVKFNNVSGLEIGDQVTVNGVRKGYVDKININGNGVLVTLKLDDDIDLRSDLKISLTMLDLMGGKKIDVSPGKSSQLLDFDSIQTGEYFADIPKVMEFLGSSQNDLLETLKEFKLTVTSLNNIIASNSFRENITNSVKNINKMTEQLTNLISDNQNQLKTLLENSNKLVLKSTSVIENNSSIINSSLNKFENILIKSDSLITNANKFLSEIKSGKNNLGKFLNDEESFIKMKETINQLNELTKILIRQLQDEGINVDAHIGIF